MKTYIITIERDGEVLESKKISLCDNSGEITMDFEHREEFNEYVDVGSPRTIEVNIKFT